MALFGKESQVRLASAALLPAGSLCARGGRLPIQRADGRPISGVTRECVIRVWKPYEWTQYAHLLLEARVV